MNAWISIAKIQLTSLQFIRCPGDHARARLKARGEKVPGGSLGVTGVTLGVEIWLLPICWTHIQGEIHGVIMDVYDSSYFIAFVFIG